MVFDGLLLVAIGVLVALGLRHGLLGPLGRATQFHTAAIGGLVAVGELQPRVHRLDDLDNPGFVAVTTFLVVVSVVLGLVIGRLAGPRMARVIAPPPADEPEPARPTRRDSVAGGVAVLGLVVVGLWLTYPALRALAGPIGRQTRDSLILDAVDDLTLAPLGVVSGPTTLIDRFPTVFDPRARPPRLGIPPPSSGLDDATVERISASVVRIRGVACSRPTEGTGFVIGPGLIVTNAHVVAGQTETVVLFDGDPSIGAVSAVAELVAFDPARDLALLAVDHSTGPGLEVAGARVGTIGAVLGHPTGRDLRVAPMQITERITGTGTDIYGEGDVRRKVYFLAADLSSGDSGAPVVDTEGRVVGVTFAISPDEPLVAFAVTDRELTDFLAADRSDEIDQTDCR